MVRGRTIAVAVGLMMTGVSGCRLLESEPSDEEVAAAVKKMPPAPPTAGPTYLAELSSVQVEQRGPYHSDGKYWPVRVRVKGGVKVKLTNVLQLGLLGDVAKELPQPIDFVEEARLTKDDFGKWRVSYGYDVTGPKWRLTERPSAGASS